MLKWRNKNMRKTEYEVRKDFIKYYGFETVSDFAKALQDDIANTTKVLQGKQKPTIEKIVKYAMVLNADIVDVISLFYPKEIAKYQKYKEKKRKTIKAGKKNK